MRSSQQLRQIETMARALRDNRGDTRWTDTEAQMLTEAYQRILSLAVNPASDRTISERLAAASAEFTRAESVLVTALEARVREVTLEAYPDGVELEVHGEYNEEGLLRLSAKRVKNAAGEIIAGLDYADEHIGGDEDGEAWDSFTDDVEGNYLTWLGELTSEDYLHDQTIFLVEPVRPDPTDFMDDDEIAAHNEAMENDPQYRDAIHMERN